MAAKLPSKPASRRLRPATPTVREHAARRQTERRRRLPGATLLAKPAGVISKALAPLRWLTKYLVPPYLRRSWRELRQVSWPNRRQSWQLTGAVIVFALIFGLVIAGVDYGLDKVFKQLLLKK